MNKWINTCILHIYSVYMHCICIYCIVLYCMYCIYIHCICTLIYGIRVHTLNYRCRIPPYTSNSKISLTWISFCTQIKIEFSCRAQIFELKFLGVHLLIFQFVHTYRNIAQVLVLQHWDTSNCKTCGINEW